MDKVNEFLKNNYSCHIICGKEYPDIEPRIECSDGFSISVQASKCHCCNPRENKSWPYNAVELGFPSKMDELISDLAEDSETKDTVFGYVPIEIVNKLIEKHGGIKE